MRRWTNTQPSLAWRETEGALAMAGESSQDEGKNRRAKRQTSPMGEKRQKRSRSRSNRRASRQAFPMGEFFSEKRQPSGRKEEEEERAEPDKERTRQADASILRGTGDVTKSGPSVGPK